MVGRGEGKDLLHAVWREGEEEETERKGEVDTWKRRKKNELGGKMMERNLVER